MHGGDECHFLRIAGLEEPPVEHLDHWVHARSRQRRHVEGLAHLGSPGAAGAELAAVPVQGCNAYEGHQLAVWQLAQFAQFPEEPSGHHRAQPWHTGELVYLLTPSGLCL